MTVIQNCLKRLQIKIDDIRNWFDSRQRCPLPTSQRRVSRAGKTYICCRRDLNALLIILSDLSAVWHSLFTASVHVVSIVIDYLCLPEWKSFGNPSLWCVATEIYRAGVTVCQRDEKSANLIALSFCYSDWHSFVRMPWEDVIGKHRMCTGKQPMLWQTFTILIIAHLGETKPQLPKEYRRRYKDSNISEQKEILMM